MDSYEHNWVRHKVKNEIILSLLFHQVIISDIKYLKAFSL